MAWDPRHGRDGCATYGNPIWLRRQGGWRGRGGSGGFCEGMVGEGARGGYVEFGHEAVGGPAAGKIVIHRVSACQSVGRGGSHWKAA